MPASAGFSFHLRTRPKERNNRKVTCRSGSKNVPNEASTTRKRTVTAGRVPIVPHKTTPQICSNQINCAPWHPGGKFECCCQPLGLPDKQTGLLGQKAKGEEKSCGVHLRALKGFQLSCSFSGGGCGRTKPQVQSWGSPGLKNTWHI